MQLRWLRDIIQAPFQAYLDSYSPTISCGIDKQHIWIKDKTRHTSLHSGNTYDAEHCTCGHESHVLYQASFTMPRACIYDERSKLLVAACHILG